MGGAITVRSRGVVANWRGDRGYGFVSPEGGGPDLFLHVSAFQSTDARPHTGMEVTYEAQVNRKGQLRAEQVVVAGEKWIRTPSVSQTGDRVLGYAVVACFSVIMILEITLWGMPTWILAVYGGASIVSFALYWRDKKAAIEGTWRVPEEQLHLLGLVGGWPGGVIAQNLFRHKTQKKHFVRYFWFTVLLNVLLFATAGFLIYLDGVNRLLGTH